MNYKYSKNIDKALTELREAISELTLPQGVQPAKVSKLSLNAFPVISLSVSSKKQSLEEISKLIDTEIKFNLEGIASIGTINVSGEQFK